MNSILDDSRLEPYRLIADPPALKRAGLFAVEGRLAVPQLLSSGYRVHSVLVSEAAFAQLEPLLDSRETVDVFIAPVDVISALGGFDFHRGALALGYRSEPPELDAILRAAEPGARDDEPIVILEGVNNPDNVGGIFRSAHAFGARSVLLGPRCGDPLYRKAIRTSMGAALHVRWTELRDWPGDLRILRDRGYRIIALTTDAAAAPLRDVIADSTSPIAFMLGSEGYGLSPDALAAATAAARIPMLRDSADSLNVAAAASIALYEYSSAR